MKCPKCQSPQVRQYGPGLVGFLLFVTGSCLLWIPLAGWVLAPLALLAAVAMWISALFPGGAVYFQCQACSNGFKVSKRDLN